MGQDTVELTEGRFGVGVTGLRPRVMLADEAPVDAPYEVECVIQSPERACLVVQARITNTGSTPLRYRGIRWACAPGQGTHLHFPASLRPRYYCTENLRGDYFAHGTTEGSAFFYPLTNQTIELGASEDQLFPGVFIGATSKPVGLLLAQATQQRFYLFFRFRGKIMEHYRWFLELEERAVGVPWLELAPGASTTGEKLFFSLVETNDPQQATAAYFRHLRSDGQFPREALNPLPRQRIYCSWNYDFFREIDEEKFLGQIPVLKEYFPTVKFLQLDSGYQHEYGPGQLANIDLCYGEPAPGFDLKRFPSGPKGLADRIKAAGLRPALWLGLWASLASPLVKEHPDWILRDDTGTPMQFERWCGGTAVLDPSVPGVRDYLDQMCRTVIGEWGYEGIKLDFSSFAFNGKRVRYRCGGQTAVELRHEVERIFRRYLPPDGFFGWCVVAGTAQPFLSQADYFRNAIDIGDGAWPTVKRIAWWTASTNVLLQERPCLPNIDSIGWTTKLDDAQLTSWLALAAVSGMALEVSGDLRKVSPNVLRRLARTLELSDPSRRVRCLDLAGAKRDPPAVWLATGERGPELLAVFNWRDQQDTISLDYPALAEFTGELRDAWTDQVLGAGGLPCEVSLEPRSAALWRLAAAAPSARRDR